MNDSIRRTVGSVAVLGLVLTAGCGGGGQELEDTPENQAFLFRDAVMTIVADKTLTIGDMARGEIPADDELFTKSATDLATLAGMATEGFMPQGIPPGSRADPAIWENWEDFQQRAQDFQEAAQAVAEAAKNGGLEAAQDLVRPLQDTCSGCHRAYRAPDE